MTRPARGPHRPRVPSSRGPLILTLPGVLLASAVSAALSEGIATPDAGGAGSTGEVGDWICRRIERSA